jgi:hypothetical protein
MENNQIIQTENTNIQIKTLDNTLVYGDLTLNDIKNSSISKANKEIIISKFGEKQIKHLDPNYAGEKLKTAINLTIFESGFKVDNISELILMIIKDIFTDFSHLTISECSIAFRNGVRGLLGDFMGLSVRTFYNWLITYNETIKAEAIKQLQYIRKEKVITDEDKERIKWEWLNTFIKDFELYKKEGVIEQLDFNNGFYEYCVKTGIGYLTIKEKLEIKELAKKRILSANNVLNAKNSDERKSFKSIVSSIANNTYNKTAEIQIVSESKRIALKIIYDKLIEKEIDLRKAVIEYEEKEKAN